MHWAQWQFFGSAKAWQVPVGFWSLVLTGYSSDVACPHSYGLPKVWLFASPLLCSGQEDSPKAADPESKDQATLLLLQVSAASVAGQEWHLVPGSGNLRLLPSYSWGRCPFSSSLSSSDFSCSSAQRSHPIPSMRFEESFTQ